jgi:hypothetical protein
LQVQHFNVIWAAGSLSQHFGLRRQSEAATALFRTGMILDCKERQVIRNSSEAKRCGTALPTALQNVAYAGRPELIALTH